MDLHEIDLTKVKLTRKEGVTTGLYVEYETGEAQGHAELTAQHHRPPHGDLQGSLAQLVPHLCFLCRAVEGVAEKDVFYSWHNPLVAEWVIDKELHYLPEFAAYLVTGYSYDAKGGVVLIGQKRLDNNKVLNLIAPREDLSPEQETGMEYPYLLALGRDLRECDNEVRLYLDGKSGPYVVQGELGFDAEDDQD